MDRERQLVDGEGAGDPVDAVVQVGVEHGQGGERGAGSKTPYRNHELVVEEALLQIDLTQRDVVGPAEGGRVRALDGEYVADVVGGQAATRGPRRLEVQGEPGNPEQLFQVPGPLG